MDRGINLDEIRDRFLSGELESVGNGTTTPDWVTKEAAAEEDWETVAKRELEINALGRDMMRQFPAEKLSGVYQEDRSSGQKKLIKSTEDVLFEMYAWLNKKAKGDTQRAIAILNSTQLIDEYRNPIIQMFKNADDAPALESSEKELAERKKIDWSGSSGQPNDILSQPMPSETTAHQVIQDNNDIRLKENKLAKKDRQDYTTGLEAKKIVGSYGIIANEKTTTLWKKGELISAIQTEDMGGFAAVKEELSVMATDADVEALFPIPEPIKIGDKVIAHLKFCNIEGKVSELDGNNVLVLYDDIKNAVADVELSVPKELVQVIS